MQQGDVVFIKKQKERQSDLQINKHWKSVRSHFFTHSIKQKLSDANIQEREQELILDLFAKEMDKQSYGCFNQSNIDLNNLGETAIHKPIVTSLLEQLQSIQKQHHKQLRYPKAIKQIIQSKITNLRVLHIQYQTKISRITDEQERRYFISAFELFKVIHVNKQLNEATIKGIFVEQFHEFTSILHLLMSQNSADQQHKYDISWMKNFSPSKLLKLSINTKVNFDISDKDDTISKINNLLSFKSLFYQISDIEFLIKFAKLNRIALWANIFQQLLKCIKEFKKIKIQIMGSLGHTKINATSAACIRSVIFGGLASLTEISQLSFSRIRLFLQAEINDILAIQQNLKALFKNNTITYLKVAFGDYFPTFCQISTLQTICLSCVSFKQSNNYLNKLIQANSSLRQIKCMGMQMQWSIGDQLFNRLQILTIHKCNNTIWGNILSQSPSNIKHLKISFSKIERANLQKAFRKLFYLNYLQLSQIDIGGEHLNTIPSVHLQQLHIRDNSVISDEDFEMIDSKWPSLTAITIYNCRNITENVWRGDKFKDLMELTVNKQILGEGTKILQGLKNKGLKVRYRQLMIHGLYQ